MVMLERYAGFLPYIIIPIVTWFMVMSSLRGLVAQTGVTALGGSGPNGDYTEVAEPPNWQRGKHDDKEDVEGGAAAPAEDPEDEATDGAPQTPADGASKTGEGSAVTFADSSIDTRVKDAVSCLTAHGTYKDGCWWKLRREVIFAT